MSEAAEPDRIGRFIELWSAYEDDIHQARKRARFVKTIKKGKWYVWDEHTYPPGGIRCDFLYGDDGKERWMLCGTVRDVAEQFLETPGIYWRLAERYPRNRTKPKSPVG